MAKKSKTESDETRLKQKIASQWNDNKKILGDQYFRSLRKRLKRNQRKRRALALRKAQAAGKGAGGKAGAGTAA